VPDTSPKPAEGHTGPLDFIRGWYAAAPVEHSPFVYYRGRVLWHNLADAMDVAHQAAAARRVRHKVKPKRVPGRDHLLWQVLPKGA
jgi:hypothetical protein